MASNVIMSGDISPKEDGILSATEPSLACTSSTALQKPLHSLSGRRGILEAARKRNVATIHRFSLPKRPRLAPSKATSGLANLNRTYSSRDVAVRDPLSTANAQAPLPLNPILDRKVDSMEQRLDSIQDSVAQLLGLMTNFSAPEQIPAQAVVTPLVEPAPFSSFNPKKRVPSLPPHTHNVGDYQEVDHVLSTHPGERRQRWLESLRQLTPHLDHPVVHQAPPQSEHFQFLQRRDAGKEFRMPFIPELSSHIEAMGEVTSYEQTFTKCPFNSVNLHYPTSESVENSLLTSRVVPRALMEEVPERNLANPGAPPSSIRLKPSLPEAIQDDSASTLAKQASAFLRLVNSQELTSQALATILSGVTSHLHALSALPNLPPEASGLISGLQEGVQLAQAAQADFEQSVQYFTPCAVQQYITAQRARQKAWLSASNLPASLQQEIVRMDLPLPSPESCEVLPLISSEAQQVIKNRLQKKQDDLFRDWHVLRARAARVKASARRRSLPSTKNPQSKKTQSATVFFFSTSCCS